MMRTVAVVLLVVASAAPAAAQEPEVKLEQKEKKKHKISGYIQVFNKLRIDHDGNGTEPDVFRVQRARIELRGEIIEHVRYDLEIDPRAPDVTGIMRDAFIAL